ncbi:MAG TPA: hypothetical protein VD866_24310 [Urbifossiella sp.]|nr:hypothetical protein [Urbifossiella sp.]
MSTGPAKSTLSAPRQRLLALCQRLHFGRIEELAVRGGEPVLDPPPRAVKEIKFGGVNDAHPAAGRADFRVKAQVVDLMALLDAVGDGTIPVVTIKHGLPFHAEVDG